MKIITISREFGSGGRKLGKAIAEHLGFDYYDREIITAIAKNQELEEAFVANIMSKSLKTTFSRKFRTNVGTDEVAEICEIACKKAKELGITISCDLNFRKKLWSKQKAGEVMGRLCHYIDYCIANEEDAKDVFGIEADNTDIYGGKLDREGYISVAKKLTERFNFKGVAITLRESKSANDNDWSAMLYTGGEAHFSKKYSMHIVDRVGGGDSFGAGLIYSLVEGFDSQRAIEFAVAASCLKHTIEGDYNMVSVAEVMNLAGGDASGRVQR